MMEYINNGLVVCVLVSIACIVVVVLAWKDPRRNDHDLNG